MQPDAYHLLAERQDSYWWHRARRKLSVALLQRYGLARPFRWLDIGCGPGGNLGMLTPMQPDLIVGVDLSPLALTLAQSRSVDAQLIRADICRHLPFAADTFGLITIFNVLYHDWVTSEVSVLAEAARVLRPDGLLLVTEPAFPILRRQMDVAAMTRRRFRGREFDELLRSAGFDVLFGSYFTSFGAPLLLGSKLMRRRTPDEPSPDMQPLSSLANRMLLTVAEIEARVIAAGLRIPFGTTLVRVCRRAATQ